MRESPLLVRCGVSGETPVSLFQWANDEDKQHCKLFGALGVQFPLGVLLRLKVIGAC